jgi:LacI family transcriptional regulator
MNLHELGRQAGLLLLDMIEGRKPQRGVRRLPCSIVARASCGAAPRTEVPSESSMAQSAA